MAGRSLAIGYVLFFLLLIIGMFTVSDQYGSTHQSSQRMDWVVAVGNLIYEALFGPRSHGAALVWVLFISVVNGLFFSAIVFLAWTALLLFKKTWSHR